MELNIIICDDDQVSLSINRTYIEEFSKKFKVRPNIQCFSTINASFNSIVKKEKIDIALLDIDLKDHSGIEVAKLIQKNSPWAVIIFITSHSEYALDAFELFAFGYLQKPIEQSRLEKLYAKAIVQVQSIKNKKISACIYFTVNKNNITLKQSSIIYIEKIQQKTRIVTFKETYEIYETLSAVEERLEYIFVRISQSIIVNMDEILSMDKNTIYMKSGQEFRIGRTFLKNVKDIYSKFPKH
ncbi:LytR/AlgR family response regulator transcription factor [Anaeromicropila populeti]|uniref:Stage 0 sporulation protein A homolog n=1 Tax=Anaeromicropila populeti TaxID=37658 RepID=A0A1I6IR72_9FIRM|nr:LytTR family DNA-binding domain-containing protein [Anaeromicropila populeti]SFR69233.1 two component transcriptional regulator, LytTR family [Anaeromicropila populeti]